MSRTTKSSTPLGGAEQVFAQKEIVVHARPVRSSSSSRSSRSRSEHYGRATGRVIQHGASGFWSELTPTGKLVTVGGIGLVLYMLLRQPSAPTQ